MQKLFKYIYYSESNDPYVNLAIENELLLKMDSGDSALFIYVNEPSVVMGRFQNPWIETNIEQLKQQGVHLVRRQSGGGCVYHDLGNLNFCFLHGDRDYKKTQNSFFIQRLMREFEISTIINERSDITLDVESKIYKFSGSAFKQKKDRSFHHCTMLVNSDLGRLNSILDSPLKNLTTKSTPSKPVPVKNLSEVKKDLSIEQIIHRLKGFGEDFRKVSLDLSDSSYLEKLESREWILGETPLFGCDIEMESESIKFEIRKGRIVSVKSQDSNLIDYCEKLIGLNILEKKELEDALGDDFIGRGIIRGLERLQLI